MAIFPVGLPALTGTQSYDPTWAQGALSAVLPFVGENRTGAVMGMDPVAGYKYLLNIGLDPEEKRAYEAYLAGNPVKYATPETPAAEEPTFDPAKLQASRQAALDKADLYLRSQGLDPAKYLPGINAEFDKVAATAPNATDPYSVFSDDIVSNVVKAQQATNRNQFTQGYENVFGQAADNQAAPSSLLDDAINSILTEQRTGAVQQLERGKARGIYNDVGYNSGMAAIDAAMASGRSDLSALGSGLIDTYRGRLDEIGDEAYNDASSRGFENFSLDPYITEYNDYVNRTRANAAGDLRGVLGGRNFFELPKIANAAGMAQGALNLRDTDVATALQERRRIGSQRRGLGSQGAF